MAKRIIFDELTEGVAAMKSHRQGKIMLRSYKIEPKRLPKVDSKLIKETREKLRCSRAVFARKLHIHERTLEKWEQGRAKPNPQAVALVLTCPTVSRHTAASRKSGTWMTRLSLLVTEPVPFTALRACPEQSERGKL